MPPQSGDGSNDAGTPPPPDASKEANGQLPLFPPSPAPAPPPVAPAPLKLARQDRRTRSLGHSREMVSELALGTWGLTGEAYGPVYYREVDRVIDRAIELGITLFDTADVYGNGSMETKLGERLDPKEHRVVTKIGTRLDLTPPRKQFDLPGLEAAFEKSRERLKRDRIDVVLLHNPSLKALDDDEVIGWLRERVKKDEVGHWGVSCGNAAVAEKAIERSAGVVMLAYNLFHQKDLHSIADRVAATETAVLARSVLAHGLLAGHWSKTKVFFDNDHRSRRWTKEELLFRLNQLPAVRNMIGGEVITLRAAALRFVLSNELVSSAVLGPRSVTQLNQLVHEAGSGPPYLPHEIMLELPERLRAVGIEP
jgi:aryl-alcohol dehydrogenase-like predicted oxidoreductase